MTAESLKYGRFVTLGEDEGRVVFLGGPGQGAGGSSAGSASGALRKATYEIPLDPDWATEYQHAVLSNEALRAGEDYLLDGVETKQGGQLGTRSVKTSERRRVKDEIVTGLSEETGVDYDTVNYIVRQWAHTSNDKSPDALMIQQEAAKMFGAPLSDWQKSKVELVASREWKEPTLKPREVRTVLNAMYERTQVQLKEAGFPEKVTLRRGMFDVQLDHLKVHNIHTNTLSSWSSNAKTALNFGAGGSIIEIQVPRERILATAKTGFGCLSEGEFVIIGNNQGSGDEVFSVPPTHTWLP